MRESKIRCFGCDRHLLTTKITNPEFPITWQVVAHCPCGDQSAFVDIKGKFIIAFPDNIACDHVNTLEDCFEYFMKDKTNDH